MGGLGAAGRNNVVLAGRGDAPVVMLAHGFGCGRAPVTATSAVTAITALLDELSEGLDDDTAVLALSIPPGAPVAARK